MDETDPKEDFYRAIADSRAKERDDAMTRLSARDEDGYRIIADAARQIAECLHGGAEPEAIARAVKSFDALPLSSQWYDFIEIAGQAVLARALSEEDAQKGLLDAGLSLMEKARSLGFPLTPLSIELLGRAAEEKGVSARARKIMEE